MNNTSFNVQSGALTWWTLGAETDPDKLSAGLDSLGLPKFAPKPRSWLMSLKTAMSEVYKRPEELIRPLKNRKTNGYTVVLEEKGETENFYMREVNASVTDEGVVELVGGNGDQIELQSLTSHYRRVLPAASVATMLTSVIEHLGGITLRAAGGLYFVPDQHVGQWMKVCEVVEQSACRDSANDISVNPLEMNEMTVRDLRRSITREMEAAAAQLREDIAKGELGDKALLNRAARASQLRERIREYEALLSQTLDVCHQHLDTAVQAFSTATAIKEHEDVFA